MRGLSMILLALTLPTPVTADPPDCTDLIAWTDRVGMPDHITPTGGLANASFCQKARAAGGNTSHHCAWSFDYRAPAAREFFEGLEAKVQTCLGAAPAGAAAPVNHPDTFDQRTFRTPDLALSLSLKDKASQRRTLVFLSAAPAGLE